MTSCKLSYLGDGVNQTATKKTDNDIIPAHSTNYFIAPICSMVEHAR